MKNRTVLGIICIALAFVIFFAALPFLKTGGSTEHTVLRAGNKITKGSLITESDLETYKTSDKNSAAYTKISDVAGKYAAADIFPGDLFTPDKITEKSGSAADALNMLGEGEFAVTVSVSSFSGGFSGQLENGDIVKIYVSGSSTEAFAPPELSYLRVITTVTGGGENRDLVCVGNQNGCELPASIMFAVNEEQARLLFDYSEKYRICCAFICHADDGRGSELLSEQNEYFRLMKENAAEEDNAADAESESAAETKKSEYGVFTEEG